MFIVLRWSLLREVVPALCLQMAAGTTSPCFSSIGIGGYAFHLSHVVVFVLEVYDKPRAQVRVLVLLFLFLFPCAFVGWWSTAI